MAIALGGSGQTAPFFVDFLAWAVLPASAMPGFVWRGRKPWERNPSLVPGDVKHVSKQGWALCHRG